MASAAEAPRQKGFLGWVERTGNRLPDPVFIFFYLIIALVIISIISAMSGVSAIHPTSVDDTSGLPLLMRAVSLLSPANITRL